MPLSARAKNQLGPGRNGQPADGCERAATPITCYQDSDGDGFGNQTVKQIFSCGTGPTGWTAKSDVFDCFDTNKDVFPGQTKYFCSSYGTSSYDYNCDGSTTCKTASTPAVVGPAASLSPPPCAVARPAF